MRKEDKTREEKRKYEEKKKRIGERNFQGRSVEKDRERRSGVEETGANWLKIGLTLK